MSWTIDENKTHVLKTSKGSATASLRGENGQSCWHIVIFKAGFNPKEEFLFASLPYDKVRERAQKLLGK